MDFIQYQSSYQHSQYTFPMTGEAGHNAFQCSAPTQDDWDYFRPTITRLYRDENKSLTQVRNTMLELGFAASTQMYKKRFSKWGIEKKNKRQEMLTAVRIIKSRRIHGKATQLKIRGRDISEYEVQRYWKRARDTVCDDDYDEQALDGIDEIQILTPHPESTGLYKAPLPTEQNLANARTAIAETSDYVVSNREISGPRAISRSPTIELLRLDANRVTSYAAFGADFNIALSEGDIMSCLDKDQAILFCVQLTLNEKSCTSMEDYTFDHSHIAYAMDVVTDQIDVGRVHAAEKRMRQFTHILEESLHHFSFIAILQIICVSQALKGVNKYRDVYERFCRCVYDIATFCWGTLHPFVLFLSQLPQCTSLDIWAELLTDIAMKIPPNSRRLLHEKLRILLRVILMKSPKIDLLLSELHSIYEISKLQPLTCIEYHMILIYSEKGRGNFAEAQKNLDALEEKSHAWKSYGNFVYYEINIMRMQCFLFHDRGLIDDSQCLWNKTFIQVKKAFGNSSVMADKIAADMISLGYKIPLEPEDCDSCDFSSEDDSECPEENVVDHSYGNGNGDGYEDYGKSEEGILHHKNDNGGYPEYNYDNSFEQVDYQIWDEEYQTVSD